MEAMQRLDRGDGLSLAYRDKGTGDPPMVFMHGMGGKSTYFSEQVRYFSPDHRVVWFDQRGRGQSSSPADGYDIPNLAEDARWLCEELGLSRPVLVGHS